VLGLMRNSPGLRPVRARADAGIVSGAEDEESAAEPNAGLGDGDGGAFHFAALQLQ